MKKSVIDESSTEFVETGVVAGSNDSARPPVEGAGSHTDGQASSSTDDLGDDVKKRQLDFLVDTVSYFGF
jgi:hypothetical protein